jgi:hypothetical protein
MSAKAGRGWKYALQLFALSCAGLLIGLGLCARGMGAGASAEWGLRVLAVSLLMFAGAVVWFIVLALILVFRAILGGSRK